MALSPSNIILNIRVDVQWPQIINNCTMEQIRKIAKNPLWFRDIVDKCKNNFKNINKQYATEQNKYSRGHFYALLVYVSSQAQLVPPTKLQAYELFDQFNDLEGGKEKQFLEKAEFDKFCSRLFDMLQATIQT